MISILRHIMAPCGGITSQVMFYASSAVDEIWIRTTALSTKACGVECCVLVGNGRLPKHVHDKYVQSGVKVVYGVTRSFIQRSRVAMVVTASSGLPEKWFPRAAKWRVHMPHSVASLHMIYSADCFDGYNMLFAVGPHHSKEFLALSKMRNLGMRPVVPVGYGKLDVLRLALNDRHSKSFPNKHVLLAPSWGAKNILNTMGQELLAGLLVRKYKVTLRPHPLFFVEGDPLLQKFSTQFAGHPNFVIENSLGEDSAIFDGDVLITDYSGIAQEFSVLHRRPVVFVDVPKKISNPDWESLHIEPIELQSRNVLGPLVGSSSGEVINAVDDVLAHEQIWLKKIEEFMPHFLYAEDCAGVASRAICSLLASDMPVGVKYE